MGALTKEDDVRQYVVAYRRKIERPGKKSYGKCPKIQRLITPERLNRKRRRKVQLRKRLENSRKEAERYNQLLAAKAKKLRDAQLLKKERRRSKSRLESTASVDSQKKQKKQKVNEGEKSAPKEPKKQKSSSNQRNLERKREKEVKKKSKTKVKVNSLVKLISEITIPCVIIICFDVLEICSKQMSTIISSQFILNIFQL